MDIHQLKVFASVFRNSSFSKASADLRLTQPTVSEHIHTLEEELGVSLFNRSGRSIHATPEAEILFARATEIIERIGEIPGALSEHRQVLAGSTASRRASAGRWSRAAPSSPNWPQACCERCRSRACG